MQIISCAFSKKPFSWSEKTSLTISFFLESGESIAAAKGGKIAISITPNNSGPSSRMFRLDSIKGVSLVAGRAYTFTFDTEFDKGDVDDVSGMNYDEIFRQHANVNTGRAFPMGVWLVVLESAGLARYEAEMDSVGTFLYDRIVPVINSVSFWDKHPANPYGIYHAYVLGGQSVPEITGSAVLDPLDTNLTATHKIEILTAIDPGGASAQQRLLASAEGNYPDALMPVMPQSVDVNGDGSYRYTVTDSAGRSATKTGSLVLYNYSLPSLLGVGSYPTVERYTEKISDEGAISYPASDDGAQVRVSYKLNVASIGFVGENPWRMDVRYGKDGADSYVDVMGARIGTDVNNGSVLQDRVLLANASFPASSRWFVTLTVTDALGNSAQLTGYIDKAGGYANIEKNGAAIGMRTTATADHKKFEVAQGYESIFYGGIRGVNILTSEEVDTGGKWLNGKTIYAKTLVHVGAAGNTAYSLNLPAGVEMAWLDMANTFHVNYNGSSYPPYAVVNNVSCFICILSTTGVVYKTNNTTGGDFYIRVFYTKTAGDNESYATLLTSDGSTFMDVNGNTFIVEA